jgi:hypothetical protein
MMRRVVRRRKAKRTRTEEVTETWKLFVGYLRNEYESMSYQLTSFLELIVQCSLLSVFSFFIWRGRHPFMRVN